MATFHFSYDLHYPEDLDAYNAAKKDLFTQIKKLKPKRVSCFVESSIIVYFDLNSTGLLDVIRSFASNNQLTYVLSEIIDDKLGLHEWHGLNQISNTFNAFYENL